MIYMMSGKIRNVKVVDHFVVNLINKLSMNRLQKPWIEIDFVNNLDAFGLCEGDKDYAKITIAKKCPVTGRKLGFMEMMQTLAHEMVHARQFIRGQLVADGAWKWKGRNADGYEYENQPWEKEAYRLEKELLMEAFPWNMEFKN